MPRRGRWRSDVAVVHEAHESTPADAGLPPYELDRLLGATLRRPLLVEETIELGDVEPAGQPVAAREA